MIDTTTWGTTWMIGGWVLPGLLLVALNITVRQMMELRPSPVRRHE